MKIKDKRIGAILALILFICLMSFVSYKWSEVIKLHLFGSGCTFFVDSRNEIIRGLPLQILKEELLWRFLPIFSCTTILLMTKNKTIRTILICVFFVFIVLVQLQFGYAHFNPKEPDKNRYYHLILQGGAGVLLAFTYVFTLCICYKSIISNKIINFITSHMFAMLSSSTVHFIMNTLLILRFTF